MMEALMRSLPMIKNGKTVNQASTIRLNVLVTNQINWKYAKIASNSESSSSPTFQPSAPLMFLH